jgi:hypothetical protein
MYAEVNKMEDFQRDEFKNQLIAKRVLWVTWPMSTAGFKLFPLSWMMSAARILVAPVKVFTSTYKLSQSMSYHI